MLLRVLLSVLGRLMVAASRRSRAFQSQCTRDLVLQITAGERVAHHFIFGRRTLASGPGTVPGPEVTLAFDTAWHGFLALSSPRAVHHIVQAMQSGRAKVSGNPALLLWFFALTRIVVPLGRQRPFRSPPPDAFLAPDPASAVADRITRWAPAERIDPAWANGAAQHQKMAMPRGSAGEPIPMW